ncbi:MAG: ABC-2 transporter permease [Candidatus Caldatribacteriota bacterium]
MKALIKKEFYIFLRKRFQFLLLLFIVTYLVIILSLNKSNNLNSILVPSLLTSFFVPYTFGWISFQEEKKNKNISYLLASPLSIKEIFLGKMLTIYLVSVGFMLWCLIISSIISVFSGKPLPTLEIILAVLITLPIWSVVWSGLVGIGLLLFDNPFIIRIFLFVFVFLIGFNPNLWKDISNLGSWKNVIFVLLGLGINLAMLHFVSLFGNERIQE